MEIPEAAIGAGAQGMFDLWGKPGNPTSVDREEAHAALQAALPALREQWGREFKEGVEALPRFEPEPYSFGNKMLGTSGISASMVEENDAGENIDRQAVLNLLEVSDDQG